MLYLSPTGNKGEAMWTIAEYEAVTLFSLKLSSATTSGGKSLLIPTPYAIKMALLDIACQKLGVHDAEVLWPQIRDLDIAIRPAEIALVTNLFQKVLRPYKHPPKPGTPDAGPFQRTIGYREYVQLVGRLGLAFESKTGNPPGWLNELLFNINYFGKRGSFFQLIGFPITSKVLSSGFVLASGEQSSFVINGTLQVIDDCTPELTFAKANIYSEEKIKKGKERITRNIVLPYRLVRSSKSYSLYQRINS
jgi:hypothetical protein